MCLGRRDGKEQKCCSGWPAVSGMCWILTGPSWSTAAAPFPTPCWFTGPWLLCWKAQAEPMALCSAGLIGI